jgi:hypothetical protein
MAQVRSVQASELPGIRTSKSRDSGGYDLGIIRLPVRVGKRRERRQAVETQRFSQVP